MSLLVAPPLANATPSIVASTPPAPTSTTLPLAALRMNCPRLTPSVTSVMQMLLGIDFPPENRFVRAKKPDHQWIFPGRRLVRSLTRPPRAGGRSPFTPLDDEERLCSVTSVLGARLRSRSPSRSCEFG